VGSLMSYRHNDKRVLKTRATKEGVMVGSRRDLGGCMDGTIERTKPMVEENEEMRLLEKARAFSS